MFLHFVNENRKKSVSTFGLNRQVLLHFVIEKRQKCFYILLKRKEKKCFYILLERTEKTNVSKFGLNKTEKKCFFIWFKQNIFSTFG